LCRNFEDFKDEAHKNDLSRYADVSSGGNSIPNISSDDK
jgi:hypothetical protein